MTPFFTIITCTYNSEKFLQTCLDSLQAQTFQDFEHIVVDGESTDNTHQILKKSGIKYYKLPASGVSAAMNEGIAHAKGKYIYFLHSDDQFSTPETLNQVHKFLLKNPDYDWVYGRIIEVNANNKPIGTFPTRKIFQLASLPLLYLYNYIPHQGVFTKKEVFSKFGGFSSLYKTSMDYEYWLRVGGRSVWSYMPITVARYRVHAGAVSASVSGRLVSGRERLILRTRSIFKIQ